jgi:hypothetical protein
MIRGLPHLCKYMPTPEESRRFISENPEKDLHFFEARESLEARLVGMGASDMSMRATPPHPMITPSSSIPPSLLSSTSQSRGDAFQQLQQSGVLSLLSSGGGAGQSRTSSSSYQNSLAFAALAPQLQQFRQAHGLDSSVPGGVDTSTSLALLAALRSTQK